jgi:iron complex transport system permease protein
VAFGLIAYLTFVADPQAREQIVFWQLGSLNGSRWAAVDTAAPLVALGAVVALALGRQLDLLALGERSARHLGVAVERLRLTSILIVAVLVSAAVAFTGVVGFVGLIVPHLVRMITGPAHRLLIGASALAGATVVVGADLAARTLVANADLPLGMLTAFVGGPVFFWLLRKTRRSQGGWA